MHDHSYSRLCIVMLTFPPCQIRVVTNDAVLCYSREFTALHWTTLHSFVLSDHWRWVCNCHISSSETAWYLGLGSRTRVSLRLEKYPPILSCLDYLRLYGVQYVTMYMYTLVLTPCIYGVDFNQSVRLMPLPKRTSRSASADGSNANGIKIMRRKVIRKRENRKG